MNCITTAILDHYTKRYLRKATIVFQQNEIVTCKSILQIVIKRKYWLVFKYTHFITSVNSNL